MTWTNNEYTYNHAYHRREGIDLLGTESVLAIGEFLVFEPEPHPSHNLVTASELDETILIRKLHSCVRNRPFGKTYAQAITNVYTCHDLRIVVTTDQFHSPVASRPSVFIR